MDGDEQMKCNRINFVSATLLLIGLCIVMSPVLAADWNIGDVNRGSDASLAMDRVGNPHISYMGFDQSVNYASWNGTAWNVQTVDAGTRYLEGPTRLGLDSLGNPVISYTDHSNLTCAVWDGNAWNIQTVGSQVDKTEYGTSYANKKSMALDSYGNPRIAYLVGEGYLKYAAWGGAGWTTETVATNDIRDESLSLDSSGRPGIAYLQTEGGANVLKYAKWDGSRWVNETVTTSGGMGVSLALNSAGSPRISFGDWYTGELKYATWDGKTWTIQTVDSGDHVFAATSLVLDSSGNPRISYRNSTGEGFSLKYAAWNGSAWTRQTIGPIKYGKPSLALDSANIPGIAYDVAGPLLYARGGMNASFSASPVSGPNPLSVTFTDSSDDAAISWSWNFGDGQVSAEKNPVHVYKNTGTYSVTLAAKDAEGLSDTTIRTNYITVTGPVPLTNFTGTPHTGTAPLTVAFTDLSVKNPPYVPDSWNWSFGDGSTVNATLQNPIHTYTAGGNYTVSLTATNSAGSATLVRAGYVNISKAIYLPPPVITSVDPVLGYWNQTINFTISGSNFQPGFTTVEFRNQSSGILRTAITSVTANEIKGMLAIPLKTSQGSWNIRVLTVSGGENTQVKSFAITPLPSPAITSVTPTTGWINTNVNYSISGMNFEPGLTSVKFMNASGYTLTGNVVREITRTTINGTVSIPPGAWIGAYQVNISTVDSGSFTSAETFAVTRFPAPVITRIEPAAGSPNTTLWFTIRGENFEPDRTSATFANVSGYTLRADSFWSSKSFLTGRITIPANAWTGAYDVTVTTDTGGSVTSLRNFTVSGRPVITSFTPVTGTRNTTVQYSISGANFETGLTTVTFANASGTALKGNVVKTVTPTAINGTISIPADTEPGAYNVTVTTADGGSVTAADRFTVIRNAVPTITAVSPATAARNTTVNYRIAGTGFVPGLTTVTIQNASGSILNSHEMTGITPTAITGTVTIPATAWTGAYTVNVTTVDGGSSRGSELFTVIKNPAPVISAVAPPAGSLNTSVTYTITGSNFQPGLTTVRFMNASGDILDGNTVTDVTLSSITGKLAIPPTAWTGAYNVNISTVDGGFVPGTGMFTVIPFPGPTISSITPATMYRGNTIVFAIAGTNFQPDLTTVYLSKYRSADITTELTSVEPTMIRGMITVPSSAATGSWDLIIDTIDGGEVSDDAAVTVL